mgnify:CR=1 FL=1
MHFTHQLEQEKGTMEFPSHGVFRFGGSKWFESEPFLKEQSDAQKGVNLDAVRLNDKWDSW